MFALLVLDFEVFKYDLLFQHPFRTPTPRECIKFDLEFKLQPTFHLEIIMTDVEENYDLITWGNVPLSDDVIWL